MNILKALAGGAKTSGRQTRPPSNVLPDLHAFVEVAIGKTTARHSIPIDAISADTLTTRVFAGLYLGASADFLYTNPAGKFRFSTVCTALDIQSAHFKIPAAVKTIELYGAKRSAVRLDSLLPVRWRYAPGGTGNGEFLKASMSDLSRGGASLVVGRELRVGSQVEVCFALKTTTSPLTVLSEVMRAAKIQTSGKISAGIRFLDVDAAGERVIDEFIDALQTLRRDRGVV